MTYIKLQDALEILDDLEYIEMLVDAGQLDYMIVGDEVAVSKKELHYFANQVKELHFANQPKNPVERSGPGILTKKEFVD